MSRRNMARIDVELGPCELCHKPAAWHLPDGRCERKSRHVYRGKHVQAFVDMDLVAGLPDGETFALFVGNAAAQVGL